MEKYLEILIFLAFAAFSLLSQFLKKKKQAVTRAPQDEVRREEEPSAENAYPPRRRPTASPRNPTSLEEILRELSGQPAEAEFEEEDDYELPPYLQERREEIGEPPPPEVVKKTPPAPKKLADKISLEDDGKRIKPLKTSVKRRGRSLGASVARSLRNPESAKRAIILSEILQRKHF